MTRKNGMLNISWKWQW